MSLIFTQDEVSHIEKELNFITENWHIHLVDAVMQLARSRGISDLYWNTSETVDSGNTAPETLQFFYERLPERLGFRSTSVDLRGRGNEIMWHLSLNKEVNAQTDGEQMFTLDQLPMGVRGRVRGIMPRLPCPSCNPEDFKKKGRKRCQQCGGKGIENLGPYKKSDLQRIFQTLKASEEKKEKRRIEENKLMRGFSYDTKETNRSQSFTDISEMVIKQRIKRGTVDQILAKNDDILDKFLSFLLSQGGHFEDDIIGFALVVPLNSNTWVINEMQTDSLRGYVFQKSELRGVRDKPAGDRVLDIDVIRDMFAAKRKSVWSVKLDDESFVSKCREDPGFIDRLPDDNAINEAGGLDAWLASDQAGGFNLAHNRIRRIFSQNVKQHRK